MTNLNANSKLRSALRRGEVTAPLILVLAACETSDGGPSVDAGFDPNPGSGAARAQAPSPAQRCFEGGDFSVLAGIFAGSSRRYNADCGFLSTVHAIYSNENATVEEKAVALRALANENPVFSEQLEAVAQAIQEGRNPLFPALGEDGVIECVVGEEVQRTAGQRTHRIERCPPRV